MDNVKPTCNGRDQDEHVRASPRSRVYTAGRARRDIGELEGTKRQQMECYVDAQPATS